MLVLRGWLINADVWLGRFQARWLVGWWGGGRVVFNDVRDRVGDMSFLPQLLRAYVGERSVGVAVSAG